MGCFHFLATMKNAAMDIHVQVLCGHIFISYLGVKLLGHVKTLRSTFWGTARLFWHLHVLIYVNKFCEQIQMRNTKTKIFCLFSKTTSKPFKMLALFAKNIYCVNCKLFCLIRSRPVDFMHTATLHQSFICINEQP